MIPHAPSPLSSVWNFVSQIEGNYISKEFKKKFSKRIFVFIRQKPAGN
jgi:hypothetical protein